MSTTSRQSNLILNQDWTRVYQTFKNADFKSYDFENLRRVIITYLRENYPEDFNDYIESSEYLALIDAVAFLGQSLAFRVDLASRENFIELASRRESVLRIAEMLNYNTKRNIGASGLLKITSVSTSEDLYDSSGRNLSSKVVSWNDPTNEDWYEQTLLVLNAAMAENTEFGRSQGSAVIQGIQTDQYRFNTFGTDVPIYTFNKNVAGRTMVFEVVSTSFENEEYIYEEAPVPGSQVGFVYRQDNKGPASHNTGFYMQFKQGSLELAEFAITEPVPNDVIAVDSNNVNNDDVWLYKLNSSGIQIEEWAKIPELIGNNIAYNSLTQDIRNVYSVVTKENDKIELKFADGVYGNMPYGLFRTYYRVSNGLNYVISPDEIQNIGITIPYISKSGVEEYIKISLSLQETITNAAETEATDEVRFNAPAQYYTQNRMITAEDYNLAPLASSQDIIKVKSINRTSSGISRNFDILDASGKYSSLNVFADDGYIYKEEGEKALNFKFTSRVEIINFIRNSIEPLFKHTDTYNFYISKTDKILFSDDDTQWTNATDDINSSSGYFNTSSDNEPLPTGIYTKSTLKYAYPGTLVKFVAPPGMSFQNGQLTPTNILDPTQTDRMWVKIISIVGDGTAGGNGLQSDSSGPIVFNDVIPTGSIVRQIVPKLVNNLSSDLEVAMANQMVQHLNFGLRYDRELAKWNIITASNLNIVDSFKIGTAGDVTSRNVDSSWIIAFLRKGDEYYIRVRTMEYIFGSISQNRFYFDQNEKSYNDATNTLTKDLTKILGVNSAPIIENGSLQILHTDIDFEIDDTIKFNDGYESTSEIKLAFADTDSDGVIDNPDAFEQVVGSDQDLNYIFFKQYIDVAGNITYKLIENKNEFIKIIQKESLIITDEIDDGQLIYFYDQNKDYIKKYNKSTNTFDFANEYKAAIGRRDLKFQYIHNAGDDRRIDPSVSNIIDTFVLTRSYDEAYRMFLREGTDQPTPLTSDNLRIEYGSTLSNIKAISDEIIYHPVKYKLLFGSKADEKFQAIFKVVKNSDMLINDNELKVKVITAINMFFDISNWDFGDTFYFSELTTYVLNQVSPDISNMVIIPRQASQTFGSLFEIRCRPDEIFISGATVDDVQVVSAITANEIGANAAAIVTRT